MRYLLVGTLLALVFLLVPSESAEAAPFCRVSNGGVESCYYYSMEACQRAANVSGGFCIYQREETYESPSRSQPQQTPTTGAPFCRVSNSGIESCYYYSMAACQRAVQTSGGACFYNRE
jgi:hypothetical protein